MDNVLEVVILAVLLLIIYWKWEDKRKNKHVYSVNLIGVKRGEELQIIALGTIMKDGLSEAQWVICLDQDLLKDRKPCVRLSKLEDFEEIRPYTFNNKEDSINTSDNIFHESSSLRIEKTISKDIFTRLIMIINNFATLPMNWDNEGALPIDKSAIIRTMRLLHIMKDSRILYDSKGQWDDLEDNSGFRYDYLRCDCTPIGGISLEWCCELTTEITFIIPPDQSEPIYYEINAYFLTLDPPDNYETTNKGYSHSLHELVNIIIESECLREKTKA